MAKQLAVDCINHLYGAIVRTSDWADENAHHNDARQQGFEGNEGKPNTGGEWNILKTEAGREFILYSTNFKFRPPILGQTLLSNLLDSTLIFVLYCY